MNTGNELNFFLAHGYLPVQGILAGAGLSHIQSEFDRAWEAAEKPVSLTKLLKYPAFVDLIEHPPVIERLRSVFGAQLQLLQADIAQQEPRQRGSERGWHRDFVFCGDCPVAVNVILYLDTMTDAQGPTRVVPGTHRGDALPPQEKTNEPLPHEVPIYAEPGDAVFINAAIWHSAGVNRSESLRRTVYLYYGYWWLKRFDNFENGKHNVPWQALQNASEQRLELLGLKMPPGNMHSYEW